MEFPLKVDAELRRLPRRQQCRRAFPDRRKAVLETGRMPLPKTINGVLVGIERQHSRKVVDQHVESELLRIHRRMRGGGTRGGIRLRVSCRLRRRAVDHASERHTSFLYCTDGRGQSLKPLKTISTTFGAPLVSVNSSV